MFSKFIWMSKVSFYITTLQHKQKKSVYSNLECELCRAIMHYALWFYVVWWVVLYLYAHCDYRNVKIRFLEWNSSVLRFSLAHKKEEKSLVKYKRKFQFKMHFRLLVTSFNFIFMGFYVPKDLSVILNLEFFFAIYFFYFLASKAKNETDLTINDYKGLLFISIHTYLNKQFVKVWWSYNVSNM